jgi:phosphomannomutase
MALNIMKDINSKIFRSYDIRGVYPDDLNEQTISLIGKAFAKLVKEKSNSQRPRVVIGRDMRISSPSLSGALVEVLLSHGVDVDYIDLVTVDAVYFAVGKFGYDGGIMVTASHNPKEYGGMKMILKGMTWVRGVELFEIIKQLSSEQVVPALGQKKLVDIWPDYISHVLSFIDQDKVKPLRVIVDAGNGMAGLAIPKITKQLPVQQTQLFFELDGNFPNRPSNPLSPDAAKSIAQEVLAQRADFGVMFDGDTDRLMLIDEQGRFIKADTTLALLVKHFLKKYPGKTAAYNVLCTKAVAETATRYGGKSIRTKVGFNNVSQGMRDHDGIIGGEISAHYIFRDNYYADSGMIAYLVFLQIISEANIPLSKLVEEFEPYYRGAEVNLEITDIDHILMQLKQTYAHGQIDTLDGITIDFGDWWFNVRPSNTEPLLRITVEAATKEKMELHRNELVEFIKEMNDKKTSL